MINVKENKYSLELAHHFKPIAQNEFSYEFSPVIGQITSISKDAPVYLIKPTKEIQHLAISIKESASMLHEEIASLLSLTKSTKKQADCVMFPTIRTVFRFECFPKQQKTEHIPFTLNRLP